MSEQVFLGGRLRLIHGDCRKIEVKADAVISDPPYGIKYRRPGRSRNDILSKRNFVNRSIVGDDIPFDPSPWLSFPQVAFTGAQFFYDRLPSGGMFHVWDKRENMPEIDQADADLVWIKTPTGRSKSMRVLHLKWRGMIKADGKRKRKALHPTQKPVNLMKWIIGLCRLPPGAVILDPYMGSGSTGVAALELGFRFVGIEIEDDFYRVAVQRLKNKRVPLF